MKYRPYDEDFLEVLMQCAAEMTDQDLFRLEPFRLFTHLIDSPSNPIYEFLYDMGYVYKDLLYTIDDLIDKNEEKEKDMSQRVNDGKITNEELQKETFIIEILTQYDKDQTAALSIPANKDLYQVIVKANEMAEQTKNEKIDIYLICIGLIRAMPSSIAEFFTAIQLDPKEIIGDFLELEVTDSVIREIKDDVTGVATTSLPDEVADFAEIVNNKINVNEKCNILGRDQEVKSLWNILLKKNKRNAILVGPPGVGKSAIIEKLTYDIMAGNAPDELKDFLVVSLDVNSSVAGTMYRGQAEERFKDLIEFLKKNQNVILFIDEIHTILGAGAVGGTDTKGLDLANALKPILARGDTRVIGATTSEEYKKYFTQDGALNRRFELIKVKEPKSDEVYPMIKNQVEYLSKYHGVKISRSMIDYIVLNASCFNYSTANPDRTLDLIDRSMVSAKLLKKKSVDRKSVLTNFDVNITVYKKMDEYSKKATAYHEAGHFIVSHFSSITKAEKTLAISIMPALDYCGVNVTEKDEIGSYSINPTKEYYIDKIAMFMAGRVAERFFTNNISAGARADLDVANKIAYDCVTKYGFSEKYGNKVFINEPEYQMQTEKTRDECNKEAKKLVDAASKRAIEILDQNKDLLEELVNELLKNSILSEKDLTRILKAHEIEVTE